jgi:putative glutamine amidotransferase
MAKKVLVGILGNVMIQNDGRFENYHKSYVNEDYVTSVLKAGGIPYIIPMINDAKSIKEQIKNVDALIFSGGDADINPKLYHQEIQKECSTPNDDRDAFDLKAFEFAKELKKPTLCICRGVQILNVFFGGSLYQDLSYAKGITIKHNQKNAPDFLAHEVTIEKDSLLYDIFKEEKIFVNSFHHQIIKDIASSLKIVAKSLDGAIEAVEYQEDEHFCMGVQWHPEMLAARDNVKMLKIFERLIKEAQNLKENR